MRRALHLAWLSSLLASAPATAQCAFDQMLKVVVRDVSPGVHANSFSAKPKTLYRVGTRYGRVEEQADPARGVHSLIVVNEPDIWMVNLLNKTAAHVVDTGKTTNFRAPVFASRGLPAVLRDFELGCELAFMKAHGAGTPKPSKLEDEPTLRYEVRIGDHSLSLDVGATDARPRRASLALKAKPLQVVRLEWTQGLAPDLTLFDVPEGIRVEESKPLRRE